MNFKETGVCLDNYNSLYIKKIHIVSFSEWLHVETIFVVCSVTVAMFGKKYTSSEENLEVRIFHLNENLKYTHICDQVVTL